MYFSCDPTKFAQPDIWTRFHEAINANSSSPSELKFRMLIDGAVKTKFCAMKNRRNFGSTLLKGLILGAICVATHKVKFETFKTEIVTDSSV